MHDIVYVDALVLLQWFAAERRACLDTRGIFYPFRTSICWPFSLPAFETMWKCQKFQRCIAFFICIVTHAFFLSQLQHGRMQGRRSVPHLDVVSALPCNVPYSSKIHHCKNRFFLRHLVQSIYYLTRYYLTSCSSSIVGAKFWQLSPWQCTRISRDHLSPAPFIRYMIIWSSSDVNLNSASN